MDNWYELPESHLVGAILLDPTVLNDVAGDLDHAHFGHGALGRIYRAARRLWQKGESPTQLEILGACNPEDQRIAEECLSVATTSAGAKAHAAGVRTESDRRALRSIARAILDGAEDRSRAPSEVAEELATSLHQLTSGNAQDFITIGDGITEFYRDLERRARSEEIIGIPSPFPKLDDLIGGFEPSLYYVIGARPGVGKSALAKQIAAHAVKHGKKALICILESSREAWLRRIVSGAIGISTQDLKRGRVPDNMWPQITEFVAKLEAQGDALTIWDTPEATPSKILAECMRLQRSQGLDMLIIDYVQLVNPGIRFHSRSEAVAHISRQMRSIGKRLHIPIIVLAQLGRQVQTDTGAMRRPVLTDLKESGGLEQDADAVIFIHRKEQDDERALLLVAKQKDGPLGKVHCNFDRKVVTFKQVAKFDDKDMR